VEMQLSGELDVGILHSVPIKDGKDLRIVQ
jgi:hypothetical protein